MNSQREHLERALAAVLGRLDPVLCPWGFRFAPDAIQSSHSGPFASGHYCRQTTRIGISSRDSIDNVYYEHTFKTRHACSTESERFTIGHLALMKALGYDEDCRLVETDGKPVAIVARDGGDPVDALIHDLRAFASSVLREPCDAFYEIICQGWRSYSIT